MYNDKDIVFITTSLNTKWLNYCKFLVKYYFPDSTHIIVDGKKGKDKWWYRWLLQLEKRNEKYFCVLDEDCFLETRNGIFDVIEELENTNTSLAGVPDNYFRVRRRNSICLNPFFMIGKTNDIIDVIKTTNYKNFRYKQEYKNKFNPCWLNDSDKQNYKFVVTNYEYFYSFFYAVLSKYNFLYLYPCDDYRFANNDYMPATNPKLNKNSKKLAIHMWYSREYTKQHSKNRYIKLEKYLKEKYKDI